jgi:hypothetical protein
MAHETVTMDKRSAAMVAYKTILRDVLDKRPSGTRQRLATALGKNRSFVTQIANPNYLVPVPVQHLPMIFEICHFSAAERDAFIKAYHAAHPRRLFPVPHLAPIRSLTVAVPDLGSVKRNAALDELMREVAARLAQILRRD